MNNLLTHVGFVSWRGKLPDRSTITIRAWFSELTTVGFKFDVEAGFTGSSHESWDGYQGEGRSFVVIKRGPREE